MPSAPARRAASRSQMLSPTTIEFSIGSSSRAAAARNRSGSGLACRTWSRVTIGVSAGSPSRSSAGRPVRCRLLVAMAQGSPAAVRAASSSWAPGSGRTEANCSR